jgi:hypothetical protein
MANGRRAIEVSMGGCIVNTFDRLWAEARIRIHAQIDRMTAAALAEIAGRSYRRSVAQRIRRERERAS